MTTPSAPTIRLVAGGNIAGSQTWSTGLSMNAGPGPYDQTVLTALLNEFRTRWTTFWGASGAGTAGALASTLADLRLFRAYLYIFPGQPVALQAAIDITPIQGTVTPKMPPQCAVVASLRTGLPGRSFRGRSYLPAMAAALGGNAQLSFAQANSIATGYAALISAMNAYTTTGGYGDAVVAGQAGNAPITSVVVDTEIDIQRRRADKILPAQAATVAVTA